MAGMLGLRGKEVLEVPPPVTDTETRISEFAPPPPTDSSLNLTLADNMDKFFDDSKLGPSVHLYSITKRNGCTTAFFPQARS